jgi:hypothetical protein
MANELTTVASDYLGRTSDGSLIASAVQAKKAPAKGKKRAPTARESQASKRQRTVSVKDDMTVTKAGPATATEQSAPLKPNQKKKRAGGKATKSVNLVSTSLDEPASTAVKSIPVFAQATSMDALDTTSIRTSFDLAKANGGSGTLYRRPSCAVSLSNSVECAKPLWDVQIVNPRGQAPNKPSRRGPSSLQAVDESLVFDAPLQLDDDSPYVQNAEARHSDAEFDDVEDADLERVADAIEEETNLARPATPNKRERKLNMRDVDEDEDYGGALVSRKDRQILGRAERWSTRGSRTDDQAENLKKVAENKIRPIVRQSFPSPVLDRSPIHGASKSGVLRTCFRVGEALTAGSHGVRTGNSTVIELYARVTASWREPAPGRKQHFIFKDLYHDRPPHLEGTFELWDQAALWDLDSKPFLSANEQGTMCRVIARMKREGGQKWRLEVLSIWQASWDDIEFVAGIYAGSTEE